MKIRRFIVVVGLLLFIAAPVRAQEEPRHREHKFWDRTNTMLFGATAAAAAADFWTTRHLVSRGARELNPIARPFAGSDAAFAAYKASSVASHVGLSYFLHRRGRHKLERVLPIVAVSIDGTATSFNFRYVF